MGQKLTQFMARIFTKPVAAIKVGMLGLDNAGKTTILYYLKSNRPHDDIIPTIGFNVETVKYKKHALNIWDVGGSQPRTKTLWSHYNKDIKAIIFVVDAADVERLSVAADELKWLWWRSEVEQAVFLIYANKQDLIPALNAEEVVKHLDLQRLSPQHSWMIQECCALNGTGLWEGIQKLMLAQENRQKKTSLLRLRKK